MYLECGLCLDGHRPDYHHPRIRGVLPRDCPFADPADMARAWEENRDHLMEQTQPGKRPHGWWLHDAPEPRRRNPVLFAFGVRGWTYYPPGTPGLTDARETEQEETESAYLDRLRLWQDGEREAWENHK